MCTPKKKLHEHALGCVVVASGIDKVILKPACKGYHNNNNGN